MRVRYVLGRAAMPKDPRRLKSGALSTDKAQDTMAWQYREECARDGEDPNPEMLQALEERDQRAWAHRLDIWSSSARRDYAISDASKISGQMVKTKGSAPRNHLACERCDWRAICEDDPSGVHVFDNPAVKEGRPPTRIGIKYNPRVTHWLNREKAGRVISPSELYSWNVCQRRWQFEYARRLSIAKEWRGFESRARGTVVHAVAEEMLKDWRNLEMTWGCPSWVAGDQMLEMLDMLGARIGTRIVGTLERISDEAGSGFQPSLLAEAMPGYIRAAWDMVALAMDGMADVIEVEERRLLKLPGTHRWITGKPDAVLLDHDGARVVLELKTSNSANLATAAERYRTNPAVDIYAAMIQQGQPAQMKKETLR